MFILKHPTASLSSSLEDLAAYGERSSILEKRIYDGAARIVSSTVFPVSLTLELFFKRIPKLLMAIGTEKFQDKARNTRKYMSAIFPSILQGFYAPQKIPKQFLKQKKDLAMPSDKKSRIASVEEMHNAYMLTGVAIAVIGLASVALNCFFLGKSTIPANTNFDEFGTCPANVLASDQNISPMLSLTGVEEKGRILPEMLPLIMKTDGDVLATSLTNFSALKQSIFVEKNAIDRDRLADGLQLIKNVTQTAADALIASGSSMKIALEGHLYDASVHAISTISIDPVSLMIKPCLLFYAYRQLRFIDHNIARPTQLLLGVATISTIRSSFFSVSTSPSFASTIFKIAAAALLITLKIRGTIQ